MNRINFLKCGPANPTAEEPNNLDVQDTLALCHFKTMTGYEKSVWECIIVPPHKLEEVAGEREIWVPLLRLLPS